MEFRNGNTFGTVAFTSYGLFWWWFALMHWTIGWGTGRLGGWIGLICGLEAMYVSFAEMANGTFGRTMLPLGGPILRP